MEGYSNREVCDFLLCTDSESEILVRRICQYILGFKAAIECELYSSTHEKKEYFKVQHVFVLEDGRVDEEACTCLGILLKNKRSKNELEIPCAIDF